MMTMKACLPNLGKGLGQIRDREPQKIQEMNWLWRGPIEEKIGKLTGQFDRVPGPSQAQDHIIQA